MTYSGIFDEVDYKEVKKLKTEIDKLKKIIDLFETDNNIKDYHINKLKDEIKDLKEALEKTE